MKLSAVLLAAVVTMAPLTKGDTVEGDLKPNLLRQVPLNLSAPATLTVTGRGGDLDCYLYEGNFATHDSKIVARDESAENGCALPATPATKLLLIHNVGTKPSHYKVSAN